jgi:hypothetical protein
MTTLIPVDYLASAIATPGNTTDSKTIKTKVLQVDLSSYAEVPKIRQITKGENKSRKLAKNRKTRLLNHDPEGQRSVRGAF